jgi:hypothetical protein
MINEDKLAFQLTGGELADILVKKLETKVERPVSTEVLAQILNVAEPTIAYYKKMGMPNNGYNSWMVSHCENWREVDYPKILKRKPKVKEWRRETITKK